MRQRMDGFSFEPEGTDCYCVAMADGFLTFVGLSRKAADDIQSELMAGKRGRALSKEECPIFRLTITPVNPPVAKYATTESDPTNKESLPVAEPEREWRVSWQILGTLGRTYLKPSDPLQNTRESMETFMRANGNRLPEVKLQSSTDGGKTWVDVNNP